MSRPGLHDAGLADGHQAAQLAMGGALLELRRRSARSVTPASAADRAGVEAERQLVAAIERHREVAASMQELGRPEAGQHVAVKSVGRAVHLVAYALGRAAEAGVPFERLVELTGWSPDLVREGLEHAVPGPPLVARLVPAGADAPAIARAAAVYEAITRLDAFTHRALADVTARADADPPPTTADVDELHARWERAWQDWHREIERRAR